VAGDLPDLSRKVIHHLLQGSAVLQVSGSQALVQPTPKALDPLQLLCKVLINWQRPHVARAKERLTVSGLEPRETQGEACRLRCFTSTGGRGRSAEVPLRGVGPGRQGRRSAHHRQQIEKAPVRLAPSSSKMMTLPPHPLEPMLLEDAPAIQEPPAAKPPSGITPERHRLQEAEPLMRRKEDAPNGAPLAGAWRLLPRHMLAISGLHCQDSLWAWGREASNRRR
jgi:hypothetical protein